MNKKFDFTDNISMEVEFPENAEVIWYNIMIAKEYNSPIKFNFRPNILDIGANVGLFTIWAIRRFQPKVVYCYEPLRSNFVILENNMNNLPDSDITVVLSNKAVEAPTRKLYFGKENCGQASFIGGTDTTSDDFEEVESINADDLPNCHILKVDTEGCEKDILVKYLQRESIPALIMYEYHTDDDRRFLDEFMYSKDFRIVGGRVDSYRWGLMKYVYNKIPLIDNYDWRKDG